MPNRLIAETSPYLRQHAENPVDWFPWGDEAFEKARRESKPVFLSVGYSACHWCHVMEHESFEDEATAALMNESFVSVKVDREERPDVDAIYMDAVQSLTGSGGWPMSVFLTPDAVPFYGGTYFPDTSRYGMPSFSEVLKQIAALWASRRGEILEAGSALKEELERQALGGTSATTGTLERETLDEAVRGLSRMFDRANGGWGGAPKFPQPAVTEFVLRRYQATRSEHLLDMATSTLDAMMRGGIYDQLGGGFHRYATDERWLVPHFEKMLYDNAQLARLYLHAWQITGDESYRLVVTETLDYVARELLDPDGGFYSAQDADSEGEEGRFFVWTPEQIQTALEAAPPDSAGDAETLMAVYGVTPGGNFEGKSILYVAQTPAERAAVSGMPESEVVSRLARARQALFEARESRVKPGLDDKVIVSWNGLALCAFAEAARVLGRDDYRRIAEKNAEFVLSQMRTPGGRMLRTWRSGHAKVNGFLEDYALYAEGLVELYQTTFEPRWLDAARELADAILEHFSDPRGGFFDTSDDHESLLLRPKGTQDGAMPSGGAVAADVLVRLTEYTGERSYADVATAALAQVHAEMVQAPLGFSRWLSALDLVLAPPAALAIVGGNVEPMLRVVRARYRPNLVVAAAASQEAEPAIALLRGRVSLGGRTTAYLCRQFACNQPVSTAEELESLLDRPESTTV